MRLVTAEEMRMADEAAINEYGIPGSVLMENAGQAVVRQAEKILGTLPGKKAAIFCGGGNNGGDGLVVARHLYNRGCEVRLYFLADPDVFRGDALTNYKIITNMGIAGFQLSEGNRLNVARMALWSSDIAIDAIFGIGLRDNPQNTSLAVINMLNESETPVISCDIPSGLSSTTGQPLGTAVKAAATVTFGYCKMGLVLPAAKSYVGELVVADISLPTQVEENLGSRRELIDEDFCRRWLLPRQLDSYKGDFGHVGVFAGSKEMPGAAILASRGALKMGAGRLTAALPAAIRSPFTAQLPEAMLLDSADNETGAIAARDLDHIAAAPVDAWLLGPGMGRDDQTLDLIRDFIPKMIVPAVLDADALFAVCGYLRLLKKSPVPIIITPHAGEMAKLLGVSVQDVQSNRVAVAEGFAKQTDVIVVLKGAGTVVATPEGRIFINSTGNPGMATGGSGDVLSGMIAALLAQGLVPAVAAACGVWIHGRAGDIAADREGIAGLMAGDIADAVPAALNAINR